MYHHQFRHLYGSTRSSAYNAGFGSGALRGENYRSEGIYAYQFMIEWGQSGPFCWHESFYDTSPTPWLGSHPRAAIVGDSPHMWGQAVATKVLIDSLIAEKIDETDPSVTSVIIGRGVPNDWLAVPNGGLIGLSNFPIAGNYPNNRMGFTLRGILNGQITLNLTGTLPSGGTVLDLRVLKNNIKSVTAGIPNSAEGTVTLDRNTTATTVTLINPNPTPIPTPSPLPTPSYTPPMGGTLIEAESGILHGCYVQADAGASGGQRVDGLDAIGDNVTLTNFPKASRIKIRYASPNRGTLHLYVNGTPTSIPITPTGTPPAAWNIYGEQTVNVPIPLNANDVTFQLDPGDVAINLDCVVVDVIEMEEGQLSPTPGPISVASDYYASAGKYVFGLFDNLLHNTTSVSFTDFPAVDQFALRYSSYLAGGTTINLYIGDNQQPQRITLPDLPFGGGTYGYGFKDVVATIPAHATVKFQFDPGLNIGGAQYDCISLAKKLEAETATLHGSQKVPDSNASGGYRVDYVAQGGYVQFNSVRRGSRLAFRYAVCPAQYGLMSLYIIDPLGNTQLTRVFFRSTGSSPCPGDLLFKDKIIAVNIPAGATVKLQYNDGDSPVSLDYIRIY